MVAFDPHSLFGYSTVASVTSQAAGTGVLNVQPGNGVRFQVGQNCTVWPPFPTMALFGTAIVIRVTAVSTDQISYTYPTEGSQTYTIAAGWQIANTTTPKVLTDIEKVLNGVTPGAIFVTPEIRNPTLEDPTDTTKRAVLDLSAITTGITGTLKFLFSTAKTLIFPDANDTLVARNTTDTLANKTLTAPVINNPAFSAGAIASAAIADGAVTFPKVANNAGIQPKSGGAITTGAITLQVVSFSIAAAGNTSTPGTASWPTAFTTLLSAMAVIVGNGIDNSTYVNGTDGSTNTTARCILFHNAAGTSTCTVHMWGLGII